MLIKSCNFENKIVYLLIVGLKRAKPITLSALLKQFTQKSVEGSLKLRRRIKKKRHFVLKKWFQQNKFKILKNSKSSIASLFPYITFYDWH
jgi:hypothetical protein